MELFNKLDEDEVDEVLTINIAIPDIAANLVPRFINRITFINDYDKFKEEDKGIHSLSSSFYYSYGKVKDKIIKFYFHIIPLYNQYRGELKFRVRWLLKDNKLMFLIFDEYHSFPEKPKENISKIKELYKEENIKEDPTFFIIRNVDELKSDSIESDTFHNEVIEYAINNKINFYYIHLAEKDDTGIEELMTNIYNEYLKKILSKKIK